MRKSHQPRVTSHKLAIFLFGPQGSGKGTQAGLLQKRTGFEILESGATIRAFVKIDSPEAREARAAMDRGELVDRRLIEKLFAQAIKEKRNERGLILDGPGRDLAEFIFEERLLTEAGFELIGVVLMLSDDEAVERLTKRLICNGCGIVVPPGVDPETFCQQCGGRVSRRSDDTKEAILERLREYHARTEPVFAQFKKNHQLITIAAQGSVDEVADRLWEALSASMV